MYVVQQRPQQVQLVPRQLRLDKGIYLRGIIPPWVFFSINQILIKCMATNITSIITQEFLAWISRNRVTFIIVVLLAGNVYQYMDRSAIETQSNADKKALNEQIQKLQMDAIDFERRRSEKLEYLINALPNKSSNTSNANNNATSKAEVSSN